MFEQSRIFAPTVTRSPAGSGLALVKPEIGEEVFIVNPYDGFTFPPEGVAPEAGAQGE